MNIRPKTLRRVALLVLVPILLFVFALGYYFHRQRIRAAMLDQYRKDGLRACLDKDYPKAIENLKKYLVGVKNDEEIRQNAEVWKEYAMARAAVPTLDGSYVTDAIDAFRKYTRLKPDDLEAAHKIVELESQIFNYNGDAAARARDLLQKDPKDLTALAALARMAAQQRKFAESLDYAQKYADADPTDLAMQAFVLELMKQLNQPLEDMLKRADAFHAQFPNDEPRFHLIKALAYYYDQDKVGQIDQREQDISAMNREVTAAAVQDPPDSQFVFMAVRLLDELRLYSKSRELLERASAKFDDPALLLDLVRRMWQNHQYGQVVDRLKDLDPNAPSASSQIIAYKALSQFDLGHKDQADALANALGKRGNDAKAVAWSICLHAYFDRGNTDTKSRLAQYMKALDRDPNNAIARYLLAQAYLDIGEIELALQELRLACREDPSWIEPHTRIADILTREGKGGEDEAIHEAERSFDPSSPSSQPWTVEQAMAELMDQYSILLKAPDRQKAGLLLKELEVDREKLPGSEFMYVDLLAHYGQGPKAIDEINNVLKKPAVFSEDLLIHLYDVSRANQLGLEKAILDAYEKTYGLTPQLAYMRAAAMLAAQQPADGLKYLLDSKDKAKPDHDAAMVWDLTICRYRENAGDKDAAAAWIKLGDDYPDKAIVQRKILEGQESAWSNRDFIRKTIDRMDEITGDDAVVWRLAQARWLLESGNSERDLPAAIELLTNVLRTAPDEVAPHVLLAQALEKPGPDQNLANAANQWRQAAELAPHSIVVLQQLLHRQVADGKIDDALVTFDSLSLLPRLPLDIVVDAANLMVRINDLNRAQKLLQLYSTDNNPPILDQTLARIDRLQGNFIEATRIYLRLAKAPRVSKSLIVDGADYFGSQHHLDLAQQYFNRLDELTLPPGQAQLIVARFDELYGNADKATADFDAAVKQAPDDPGVRAEQIGFLIRANRFDQATARLADAISRWPSDARLTSLSQLRDLLAGNAKLMQDKSLLDAATEHPENPVARETLAAVADVYAKKTGVPDLLGKLDLLITNHPDFQPLYLEKVIWLLAAQRGGEAADLAKKSMDRFPDSAEAARLATTIFNDQKRWSDVEAAAQKWRDRGGAPVLPDCYLAEARFQLDRPQEAVDTIKGYIAAARVRPDDPISKLLLQVYAGSLVKVNREDEAVEILKPLAQREPEWRLHWLSMSITTHSTPAAALAWAQGVQPLLDPASFAERFAFAKTCMNIGDHWSFDPAYAAARDGLLPSMGKPEMTADGYFVVGAAAEGLHDAALAERAYRAGLLLDVNDCNLLNNLADLLRLKGDPQSLAEAQTLAVKACDLGGKSPAFPAYCDTLARIHLAKNDPSDAVDVFLRGLKPAPNSETLLIGLAVAYLKLDQLDAARNYLARYDAIVPPPNLSPELQHDLASVRAALNKPGPGPGPDRAPTTNPH